MESFCFSVQVEKTVWDWELLNTNKPIWTRKPKEVKEDEYNAFYKSFTKVKFILIKCFHLSVENMHL